MENDANLVKVRFTVNGRLCSTAIEPSTTLADCLRDDLQVKSVHLGCEHGVCGACNVMLDGKVVRSCLTLAVSCQEVEVITLEGLDDAPAQAMKDAFRSHHALQCGFCTPGFMVTACAMQRAARSWSRDEIRTHVAGNICRCTGYQGLVEAIHEGVQALRQDVATAPSAKEAA